MFTEKIDNTNKARYPLVRDILNLGLLSFVTIADYFLQSDQVMQFFAIQLVIFP